MAPNRWLTIAEWSLCALACEVGFGFSLGFNPGWANGWPLGLTINSIWSVSMSVLFFLLLMTAAVGLGAIIGAACSHYSVGLRHGGAVYTTWLVCACFLALLASHLAFREVYASTLEMWPNGYNP